MPNAAVVVDSGPLIALFDADDAYHQRAVEFVHQRRTRLISSMAAITETMYVLENSLRACKNVLVWLERGGLTLMEPEIKDFERIGELMVKYADLPMDFTDAVLVSLCERLGTNRIASVDRDFGIYRLKGRARFINVFLS